MYISVSTFQQIKKHIGHSTPECGGIIGRKGNTICSFFFDGIGDYSHYTPNIDGINSVITFWTGMGIEFAGFVHSHPNRNGQLSISDRAYIREIMRLNANGARQILFFPIVLPCDDDNDFEFISYKATESRGVVTISNDAVVLRN